MASRRSIGVGLIGFGTIGTGVIRVLREHSAEIRTSLGVPLRLAGVADLDLTTDRGVRVPRTLMTKDAGALINDPKVDVVVELIGGTRPALDFHRAALAAGKVGCFGQQGAVVRARPGVGRCRGAGGLGYGFEASVGGGIPIVRVLKEGLAADRNAEVYGIVNGTANYILSRMSAGAGGFDEVLADAQAKGLAEADPTYDIDGIDSLHKLVVLCALAFGKKVSAASIPVDGIRSISGIDIAYAREFGYAIKLLAVARQSSAGIEASVHPAMVPIQHPLSQVSDAYCAICLNGRALGTSLYYGQGAGMMPTATAVVADVVEVARSLVSGQVPAVRPYGVPCADLKTARVVPPGKMSHEHYIRFQLRDRPGVLAKISGILGRADIGIATVAQHEAPRRGVVPVVVRTHRANEKQLAAALVKIRKLSECRGQPVVIRVEDGLGERV